MVWVRCSGKSAGAHEYEHGALSGGRLDASHGRGKCRVTVTTAHGVVVGGLCFGLASTEQVFRPAIGDHVVCPSDLWSSLESGVQLTRQSQSVIAPPVKLGQDRPTHYAGGAMTT